MEYKIGIVDDHPVAVLGIEAVLKGYSKFKIVFKLSSGKDIAEKLSTINTDLLILDVDIPFLSGIEFLKNYRLKFPHLKIVLFTVHEGEGFFQEAVKLGADVYILKSDNIIHLENYLQTVLDGHFYCSPKLMKFLINKKSGFALSEKETNILKLVINGHTAGEIADRLDMSRRTVEYYIARLKEKFDAENLFGLIESAKEKYFF